MYMYCTYTLNICVHVLCIYVLSSVARVVVVKISGPPILCKTDEIGEICVQSMATGSAYWGLQGKSTHTFRVWTIHVYTCTCVLFRL